MKAELDKMVEAKEQAVGLYESIKVERVSFSIKEREYEDRLIKMGVELEVKSASELRLLDDNAVLKTWGEEVAQKAEVEQQRVEEECARCREPIRKVQEANGRAKEVIQRVEEAEAKAIKAVEVWRESFEFDALAQDAYVVAWRSSSSTSAGNVLTSMQHS